MADSKIITIDGSQYTIGFTNCGKHFLSMGGYIFKNEPKNMEYNPYNKDK